MYLKINQMKKLELIQTVTKEILKKGATFLVRDVARKLKMKSIHLIEGGNTILAKADEDKL
jgi:hypothetical protein